MRLRVFFLAGILFFLVNLYGHAEHVFLNNGKIINGTILSETANFVVIRQYKGKKQRVSRKDIMRVLYTKLYMGRIFVQQTDGSGLELYMVDEDQDTYTFRRDIDIPKEITLKRSDVLFIARKNPSGLEGVSAPTSIFTTWNAPYNKVKCYNVYLKKSRKEKYALVSKVFSKSYTIKNLKSNSRFFIIVTAIDMDNYESLPSNQIEVNTLNIKPDSPENFSIVIEKNKNINKSDVFLSWNESSDGDGTVKGYNIYKCVKEKYTKIGSTADLSFSVMGLNPDESNYFIVRAIDNLGEESENSKKVSTVPLKLDLTAGYSYFYPGLKFKDLYEFSCGYSGSIFLRGLFQENYSFGINASYFDLKSKKKYIDRSVFIPVHLLFEYEYSLASWVSLLGKAGVGCSYNDVSYDHSDPEGQSFTSDKAYEPIVTIGGIVLVDLWDLILIEGGIDYTTLFEEGGNLSYFSINGNIGFRF